MKISQIFDDVPAPDPATPAKRAGLLNLRRQNLVERLRIVTWRSGRQELRGDEEIREIEAEMQNDERFGDV